MKCVGLNELAREVSGLLPLERVASLEQHCLSCEDCAQVREDIVAMTRRMAPAPGEFEDEQFAHDVMTLIQLGRAKSAKIPAVKSVRWSFVWVPLAAGMLAAFVLAWPYFAPDKGFHVRGGAEDSFNRWISLKIFRATPQGYQPVLDRVQSDDRLAFAYSNRSEQFNYLMVFGVDDKGRVFWYFPAHLNPDGNPQSIPIEHTQETVDLPDDVRHKLQPGFIRIFSLFSVEPLDVQSIETQIAQEMKEADGLFQVFRLQIEGVGQQSFFLRIYE